jgi:hypothetical protein
MPPVFGRHDPNPHAYDLAIASWLASLEPDLRAIARNIMQDARVCVEREAEFDTFVDRPVTAGSLERAVIDYFNERIRTRKLPDYVYRTMNGANLLTGHSVTQPIIHKDVKLVRVLDLNRLAPVYQWASDPGRAKATWKKALTSFPVNPRSPEIAKWLDDELGAASAEDREEFLGTVLDMVNSYRSGNPFQPTWATTWAAFETIVKEGAERWLETLGMAATPPRWLMLLSYPVREAGTLAVPCVLDSGWYAYYFPTPAERDVVSGHPMDLRLRPKANQLIPEYIHKQIHHPIEHWYQAGSELRRAEKPNLEDITDQRMAHYRLLCRHYGSARVLSWMDMPV